MYLQGLTTSWRGSHNTCSDLKNLQWHWFKHRYVTLAELWVHTRVANPCHCVFSAFVALPNQAENCSWMTQSLFTLRPDIPTKPEVYHPRGLTCVYRDNKCTALLKPPQLGIVDCLVSNTAFKAVQVGCFTKKMIFYCLRWRSTMKTVESSYSICQRDTPTFKKGEQCTRNCVNRVKCLFVSPSLVTKNSKGLQRILQVSQDTP